MPPESFLCLLDPWIRISASFIFLNPRVLEKSILSPCIQPYFGGQYNLNSIYIKFAAIHAIVFGYDLLPFLIDLQIAP